jgi:hypothetical protein
MTRCKRSRFVLPWLFAVGGALGCASDADGDDDGAPEDDGVEPPDRPDVPDTDGDRLIARTFSFPGGTPVQTSWYDQELEAPCSFGVAADGQLRCIPQARQASLYYPGADCSGSGPLIIQVLPPCEAGAEGFALVSEEATCPASTRAFRLGALHGGRVYSRRPDGSCYEVWRDPATTYYEAEEVAATGMVAAERAPVGAGRLRRYVDFAEDGARQHTSEFRDIELGGTCTVTWATDGVERCVPGDSPIYPTFPASSDASCSDDVTWVPPCWQSKFIGLEQELSGCGESHRAYELGEILPEETPLYFESDGECFQLEDEFGQGTIRRFTEVDPSRMFGPEIELRGEGRVRDRWAVLDDGTAVFRDWFDSSLETSCIPLTVDDGSSLCVPDHMAFVDSSNYFSDPDCSQVRTVTGTGDDCDVSIAHLVTIGSDHCQGHHFYGIGGPVEGDLFVIDYDPDTDSSTCRSVDDADRTHMREVGEEIDPDAFERATSVSD